MEPHSKTNENNDEALERAEVFNGDLPESTENKDMFANEIEGLEETLQDSKNKTKPDNYDLADRVAAWLDTDAPVHASGGAPGSHRGHVTDPAHDHRLKQNHDRSDNSAESDDDKKQEDDDDQVNEAYERAQQRKIEEHKRLLEQQQSSDNSSANQSKDLAFRQREVNIQNAHGAIASLLNKVRNHEVSGLK